MKLVCYVNRDCKRASGSVPGNLEQQCTQEINLITDLLKLQELESHQATLNLQTIDINPSSKI